MKEKIKNFVTGFIVLSLIVAFFIWISGDNSETEKPAFSPRYYSSSHYEDYETGVISRDEAIEYYWDEIKENLSGTETIDTCRVGGNCYSLDADIYGGYVDTIYFPNGGHLELGAEIDENGYASEYDINGDEWELNLDMNSSIVDEAIDEWANENNYTLE